MAKHAILFGSIGTIAETSELQRRAFNQAFEEFGLDWSWEEAEYKRLLEQSGGRQRIAAYAAARGDTVDAAAIHTRKTEIFDAAMRDQGLALRPHVAETIQAAKDHGHAVGFVTTTSQDNIDALLDAVSPQLSRNDFDFIGHRDMVAAGKPNPDIYVKAMEEIGVDADRCIAIEDTPVSLLAAATAGIPCVGFPGAYADRDGFGAATFVTDRIDYDMLMGATAER